MSDAILLRLDLCSCGIDKLNVKPIVKIVAYQVMIDNCLVPRHIRALCPMGIVYPIVHFRMEV